MPILIFFGLLLIALVLPSKRDTSVAAWWKRVRQTINVAFRVALALMIVAAIIWFVVLPILDWNSINR